MFTGLVERIGKVENVIELENAREFVISISDDDFLKGAILGESISTSGVCLTVTELSERSFKVTAVEETLRRSTLGLIKNGSNVNLERALAVGARFGGHIVQGHVDAVADIISIRSEGESYWITFQPPTDLMRYIVEKGSICLDGISLTVANTAYNKFSIALIPHTFEVTTAANWETGTKVNVEVDVVAKYVERLTNWSRGQERD
jgi:riboflavin synthase